MKYRVQIDLFLDLEKDKDALVAAIKPFVAKAVTVKTETSTAKWHLCGHDEGTPCESAQKI